MTLTPDLRARRDKLDEELTLLQEAVAEALRNARVLTMTVHARTAELSASVDANLKEFENLDHRMRSVRAGILGLYDEDEAKGKTP